MGPFLEETKEEAFHDHQGQEGVESQGGEGAKAQES